ncbi:hypothetical protein GL982_11025 (plasmid) [Spiroplasma citri]|uniref:hypothetical protein n=1 Tax=Spiroplasma citri TaxID=2133 RepID=UPI0013A08F88|nr:hypothetical protein [Spiroplasma citri]QIA74076.1 hypothetical protein GL982_11025 [Spiroplasma citri]
METVNLTLLAFLVIIFVIIVFKRFKKIVQEQYWSTDDFKNVKEMYKKHNENVKKFLEKDKKKIN